MQELEFVCLANSYRPPGGRCIAGILTSDWLTWVRPVTSVGALPDSSCSGFGLLDVIRVSARQPCADQYQPENWELANDRVRRIRTLTPAESLRLLRSWTDESPLIFGKSAAGVAETIFDEEPAKASLVIVEPKGLRWTVAMKKRKQVRAIFHLGPISYDLPVTDPLWIDRFADKQVGSTFPGTFGGVSASHQVFMTISMGAPYEGKCFKLVAAVIAVRG